MQDSNTIKTLNTEFDLTMKKFMKLQKKIEKLDKANDPRAENLRLDIDVIADKLGSLSAAIENLEKK